MMDDLDTFFARVDRDEPQDQALQLSQNVEDQLRNALRMEDRQRAAQEIMRIERSAAAGLRDLESRYRVARPKIALTKALQREWQAYTVASAELETNVFRGTRMAVEIINHEFRATVGSLRNNLRGLKAWADVNRGTRWLYRNIRASFDHLDGYRLGLPGRVRKSTKGCAGTAATCRYVEYGTQER